ncbi:polysaccharide deacetylase family protein [Cohnella lubricantis]|uniref:Polysaccharide deacetylase family protein n=1 Tax=Cohnella lubricantis TaxID=2163172 RepID=A0A841T8T4_9BACL|nr:polysaccharide deacetylase family protein [Cohnella lubricantis]MBB6675838.1 polysaccharide deacetylase family protein [Cohnella lubricantis]MBP2119748.1 peptidoglycan/xylan/chitin deacetylase (PgdA/CDA1 family) [Cohnella lubricantis]
MRLLWWIFYFLTVYAFIPGFVSRVFGFRVFRKGLAKREIALTFDDGPDPVYTPKLLDALKRYDAKATFFVVGAHAEQNPELIRRMHEEGHAIGIHNYVHRSNWIMSPWTVKRHVLRTSQIIESITGKQPQYYRPPWGIVNIFDFAQLRSLNIVLWTKMFGDWKKKVGADNLYRKMRESFFPGQVFLLHDRGDTFGADEEAPAHTIAAVERILEDGRELGLQFVAIDELIALSDSNRAARLESKRAVRGKGGSSDVQENAKKAGAGSSVKAGPFKQVVVWAWMQWERLFHVMFRLHPVGDGSFMHYRIIKYGGPDLVLRDQSRIQRGDLVAEMHFDNEAMYRIGMQSKSALQIALRLIRETKVALPDISRQLEVIHREKNVKAIFGISMVNRGAEGLGFDTFPLQPGLFSKMTNWYLKLLMSIIHPDGKAKVKRQREKLEPRMILMSREMLNLWQDPEAAEAALKEAQQSKKPSPAAAARQSELLMDGAGEPLIQ